MTDPSRVRLIFRTVAFAEACSWLGLLIGMYFKYGTDAANETGVHVFGPIHGAIFTCFVVMCLVARRTFNWSPKTTALALFSSVPPFATAVFEVAAERNGLLGTAGETAISA